MKLALIATAAVLLILLFACQSKLSEKRYDWNMGMTKPVDYDISVERVLFLRGSQETYRYTTMNTVSGWGGSASGTVLHNTSKAYLPDSIKLAWTEANTGVRYAGVLAFPKKKVAEYYKENYDLLTEKWGSDYPVGQLSLKLGIAPGGLLTLWFSGMDTRTSGFGMEVDSYRVKPEGRAEEQGQVATPLSENLRFGAIHYYPFEGENPVGIYTLFHNGESQGIGLKEESNSVIKRINGERGWGPAKEIVLQWFDKAGQGYRWTYEVPLSAFPKLDGSALPHNEEIVYLLDRENTPAGEWNLLPDKHVLELKALRKEKLN